MITTLLTALLVSDLSSARPAPKIPSIHRPHQHWPRGPAAKGPMPEGVSAPYTNIFASLSNDEAAGVIKFLHDQPTLNLTASADAGSWDNWIMVVDTYTPNKTDALAFFDQGGQAPPRYAVASLSFGATTEPYVQDWVVGPLPVSDQTTMYPDEFGTRNPEAKIRVHDMDSTYYWLEEQVLPMTDIINDLLQSNVTNADEFESEFALWGIDPLWREPGDGGDERIIYWAQIWRGGQGTGGDTLLPQGIYFKCDITGRDRSQWALKGILYGDEYYQTPDEFRAAWQTEGFVKYAPNLPGDWINTKKQGDALPLEDQAPPQEVLPGGQRFKVDEAQKYVQWMDFSFFITFTRDTGTRLFDIKYKGERIIYELGLQEAIAHYAGNDPQQSGTAYLDTYYGFGPFCFNQVPGYDMPSYAYCMDATWHADELSRSRHCGISLFEQEMPYPLSRHTTSNYVAVTKNIAFTVRSISTIGNYDYAFDYVFYLDGSIETLVRASGYIQTAFYAKNEGYGYKIHDNLSGSMHDHVLHFKADLDIVGTANTMVKHSFEPATKEYKWSPIPRNTMELVRSEVINEDQGKMNWAENSKEKVVIVNKDAKNTYGEERGYMIMPSRGPAGMRLTVQDSTNLQKSGSTGSYQYYVTKHKDEEKRSVSAWNAYDPGNPLVNFDEFFNSENLVQEDIVLWFNLGMHHVPHTGDLPNTVFTTAQAGMWITPHNYLLSDPSRQSSQMVHIEFNGEGGVANVDTFGQQAPTGGHDFTSTAWDPWSYTGDIAVRKFPYDPQNPFPV